MSHDVLSRPAVSEPLASHPPMHPLLRVTCVTTIVVGLMVAGHLLVGDYWLYQLNQMLSDAVPTLDGRSPLQTLCAEQPANPMCAPPGSGR